MAGTDGIGSIGAPTGGTGRRVTLPGQGRVTGRDLPQRFEVENRPRASGLGELYDARGQAVAEAVRTRRVDQTLGELADRIVNNRNDLEPVKLYPPYPLDEPRRAAAIREFNGVAEEAARVLPGAGHLAPLHERATTEQVNQALAQMESAEAEITARRQELATQVAARVATPPAVAERASAEIRAELERTDRALSRESSSALRLLA